MRIITPEDLVRYLYNETPPQKMKAIQAAIATDWSLRETFEQIVFTKQQLDEVRYSPREEAVERIVSYAGKTVSRSHSHSH